MLGLKKIKLSKTKKFFKRLPRILGENAFLTSLILVLISLILGGLVFYKYSFLVEARKPEVLEKPVFLNEEALQEILKTWQDRQKKFEEAEFKEYPNPFKITR